MEIQLPAFGIRPDNIQATETEILGLFENGIGKLNVQQLKNLSDEWRRNSDEQRIVDKLNYYGLGEQFHRPILDYLQGCKVTSATMPVTDIDESFEGLQGVTRDSFHKLITDGYSGEWKVKPEKVKPLRLQIASMNDEGPHPRGWYIQADIIFFEEVEYEGQKRYRIHCKNAVAIDSGCRNIKFNQQPVTYIKRNLC